MVGCGGGIRILFLIYTRDAQNLKSQKYTETSGKTFLFLVRHHQARQIPTKVLTREKRGLVLTVEW